MWRTLIAVTCLSLVVGIYRGVAFATWLEVQLTGPAIVIVWKTPDAMKAGQELIRSGARVSAGELAVQVAQFASCAVATGTRAEVTRVAASWLWHAKVLDGPDAGCVGIIAPRDFKTRDELSDPPGRAQAPRPPPPGPSRT